jgi:hypothetical protein
MSEFVRKSVAQEQQAQQKIETRTAVARIAGFALIATALAGLAVLGAAALFAQGQDKDKYSLVSPGGIAFSDFRGYEDWADVSSARTTEILKVIVANPTMINAYKAGVPAFPGGVEDRQAPVEVEEEHGGPFRRGSARRLFPGFRDGKGQQEIFEKRRMGIRGVQLRPRIR